MPLLEIAVTTLEDARHALEGGADSIEVSEMLEQGGLTPNFDLVKSILREVRLDVHVMVRPHSKSFQYDRPDIETILRDAKRFSELSVKSIVFGAQDVQQRLDFSLIERVMSAASPVPLTIHRALDLSAEPEASLDALAALGIRRVLTAGPAEDAWRGREGLARWVKRYESKISFVVSGGLNLNQFSELAAQVRAPEYHFGSAARTAGIVEVSKVRELRTALGNL